MSKGVIISLLLLLTTVLPSVAQVNIWEGTSTHHRVELTAYPVEGDQHPAVIICPGGSYFWHDMVNEGRLVAKWLNDNGIAAFVLRYRTGYVPAFVTHYRLIFRGNRHPDAINDLRQSLRYIKRNSTAYNIDTTKIGVMGFSAGGHLAMSSVELLPKSEWPAFIAAIYPVVTMSQPCVHKRSRRGLLGDNREHNRLLCDSLSVEKHVPDGCPPVFLMNCADDPVVKKHNSELLDSALTAKGIPHKYIQYKTGGHGFGASEEKGTKECRQWRREFMEWFRQLK
jgi:acetyl esterase/lipase